jgi:hypothetical protein
MRNFLICNHLITKIGDRINNVSIKPYFEISGSYEISLIHLGAYSITEFK